MILLDELRREHVLIERVVFALFAWAGEAERGAAQRTTGLDFVRFFRVWAGEFHHAREEGVLFPALVEHAEVPADRGPLRVLVDDHAAMGEALAHLGTACLDERGSATQLAQLARHYGEALLHHLDAENHVLFPEAETRMRAANVHELAGRGPTEVELEARALGERLAVGVPIEGPSEVIRGESCTVCPAFGARCEGIEREWWSDEEREDFFARLG